MININILKVITLFSAIIFLQAFSAGTASAQTVCTASSIANDTHKVTEDGTDEWYCKKTPDELIFTIYEIGVCTTASSPDDRTACTALFTNIDGYAANLSSGASIPMSAGVTLTEGTYNTGYIIVDTTQKIKISHEFTNSTSARDNNTSSETSGKFCFTNGNDLGDRDSITCASASAAVASSTYAKIIGDGPNFNNDSIAYAVGGAAAQTTKIWVLDTQTSTTASSGDLNLDGGGDFQSFKAGSIRKYIYADQTLSTPMKITANSTGLDIAFNVQGSTSLLFRTPTGGTGPDGAADGNCDGCLEDVAFEGMRFAFTAN
jgi:hypothetical protein